MKRNFLAELNKLKDKSHIDKKIYQFFLQLINSDKNIVRDKKARKHICSYFLPVNKEGNSIYLVHHIKAKMWIPPGGHIEKNESPLKTVHREFVEELDYRLTNEKIELFNLTVTNINPPRKDCLIHYDLWYLVYVDKINFKFCKREFYTAGWFKIDEAIKKTNRKEYIEILRKLQRHLKS